MITKGYIIQYQHYHNIYILILLEAIISFLLSVIVMIVKTIINIRAIIEGFDKG